MGFSEEEEKDDCMLDSTVNDLVGGIAATENRGKTLLLNELLGTVVWLLLALEKLICRAKQAERNGTFDW